LLRRFGQGELRRNRNEASSDGVFAIVVTLLILELKVPILHDRGSANELGHRLVGLLPKFELAHQLHHWLQILAESSSPRKR